MVTESKPESSISRFLAARIEAGDFPSAVYLAAQQGQVVFADALGQAVIEPYRIAASLDTVYDLASLTKPLITGLLCARRMEQGELTLDLSAANYLPEFDRPDKQMITIRQLLTHTSGLPAWRPLYLLADGEPERVLGVIANEELEHPPGAGVIYSDLGFITLGFLLERLTGIRLTELARQEIINPLQLDSTLFNPAPSMQTVIAASETGNAYEREISLGSSSGSSEGWREHQIWGEVHDGNAYFLGGAAGHAGLFSTAYETARIARQFLAGSTELLRPETCTWFRTNMTAGLEEARAIAWQLAATKDATAGRNLPPDSFGHTGFTGTSCWVDPNSEGIFILLTNRTHGRPHPFVNINSVRREFHTLARAALDNSGS